MWNTSGSVLLIKIHDNKQSMWISRIFKRGFWLAGSTRDAPGSVLLRTIPENTQSMCISRIFKHSFWLAGSIAASQSEAIWEKCMFTNRGHPRPQLPVSMNTHWDHVRGPNQVSSQKALDMGQWVRVLAVRQMPYINRDKTSSQQRRENVPQCTPYLPELESRHHGNILHCSSRRALVDSIQLYLCSYPLFCSTPCRLVYPIHNREILWEKRYTYIFIWEAIGLCSKGFSVCQV